MEETYKAQSNILFNETTTTTTTATTSVVDNNTSSSEQKQQGLSELLSSLEVSHNDIVARVQRIQERFYQQKELAEKQLAAAIIQKQKVHIHLTRNMI